jgi:hypothetical protein
MGNLRTGSFGSYYGSYIGGSKPLSFDQMKVNAKYIYSYLINEGWTINAISGMLGNIEAESTMNPGRWQNDNVGVSSLGYGLVQWTPSTKYIDWCTSEGITDSSEMDSNLRRIIYESENNIQWIATSSYNMSFKEFSNSTLSVSELAKAFLLNYERPADQSSEVQNYRAELGLQWYLYLQGSDPESPTYTPSNRKKRNYNFILFQANRRRNQWIKNQLFLK